MHYSGFGFSLVFNVELKSQLRHVNIIAKSLCKIQKKRMVPKYSSHTLQVVPAGLEPACRRYYRDLRSLVSYVDIMLGRKALARVELASSLHAGACFATCYQLHHRAEIATVRPIPFTVAKPLTLQRAWVYLKSRRACRDLFPGRGRVVLGSLTSTPQQERTPAIYSAAAGASSSSVGLPTSCS